jgi:hypothetical protein
VDLEIYKIDTKKVHDPRHISDKYKARYVTL